MVCPGSGPGEPLSGPWPGGAAEDPPAERPRWGAGKRPADARPAGRCGAACAALPGAGTRGPRLLRRARGLCCVRGSPSLRARLCVATRPRYSNHKSVCLCRARLAPLVVPSPIPGRSPVSARSRPTGADPRQRQCASARPSARAAGARQTRRLPAFLSLCFRRHAAFEIEQTDPKLALG